MNKIACIVLPTFNEVENVEALIWQIFEQSKNIYSHDLHVVVADDDSPDGTEQAVRSLMGTFPNLHLSTGKKGIGRSVQKGNRIRAKRT